MIALRLSLQDGDNYDAELDEISLYDLVQVILIS